MTEIISPYRIAAFNRLAADPRIDLTVLFFCETEDRRLWRVPQPSVMHFRYAVVPGRIVGRRYQAGSLFFNPGILGYLRRGKYDVVVTGGYHHPTIWLTLAACRLSRVRVLAWSESTARDARSSGWATDRFKRALIRRFSGFIAAGSAQRMYLQTLGAATERIWVAPDSVDVDFFAAACGLRSSGGPQLKQRLGLDGPTVMYVGRLLDAKGVPDLIDAFARVSDRHEANLLLVGDGPDRGKYERECAHRELKRVRFMGFVQPDELPTYYAAADVFAFPTHSDPWGLAINEAMAAGLTVVASSAAGAVDDLIAHGDTGFVHAPGDREALAALLSRLVADESLRRQVSARARTRIAAFTPARMAQGIVEAALQLPNQARIEPLGARGGDPSAAWQNTVEGRPGEETERTWTGAER
jgi:glycosyltransferase involved in cell wall biosynthesis